MDVTYSQWWTICCIHLCPPCDCNVAIENCCCIERSRHSRHTALLLLFSALLLKCKFVTIKSVVKNLTSFHVVIVIFSGYGFLAHADDLTTFSATYDCSMFLVLFLSLSHCFSRFPSYFPLCFLLFPALNSMFELDSLLMEWPDKYFRCNIHMQ